jgi:chromosome segregation ATPase
VEVGVIPESVRALQKQVDDKRKETAKIAKELNEAEAKKNPTGRTRFVSREVANNEPGQGDAAIFKKLEAVRVDIAAREEQKRNRLAELNAKRAEMSATYAAGHPDMIALQNTIAATQQDPAELVAARAEERRLAQEFESSKNAKLGERRTVIVATTDSAAPAIPQVPQSIEGLRAAYDRLEKQLTDLEADLNRQKVDEKRIELAFKNRYSVTRPPEVPGGPKKPVGAMAGVIGALCTIALMLVAAVLRDRASGLFYEPRDVRDRLGLPVYATMKW